MCDLKSNEIEFEEEIAANDDISIEQTGLLNDFEKERKSYCKIQGGGGEKSKLVEEKFNVFHNSNISYLYSKVNTKKPLKICFHVYS